MFPLLFWKGAHMDDIQVLKTELSLDDLKLKDQELARIIGMEKFIEVCGEIGGGYFYIPGIKDISNILIKRKAMEKKPLVQSGVLTYRQLARMYGRSESTIISWLKDGG